jgi:hypothetical protein
VLHADERSSLKRSSTARRKREERRHRGLQRHQLPHLAREEDRTPRRSRLNVFRQERR